MLSALHDLPDDVVIYLYDLLEVPGILTLRQTCKRMQKISELRIVWTNACTHQILRHRYPFPEVALDTLTVPALERHVRHAYLLGCRWLSGEPLRGCVHSEFEATSGTPVSDLRFVPGHAGNWLLLVSKSIWSIITVWEIFDSGAPPIKRFEWSRRDCLLLSFVLNDDPASSAVLAVSIIQEGHTYIEILSLREEAGFRSLGTIDSPLTPVHFRGDMLVLCDPIDVSVVVNWRTGASALLQRPQDASQTAISLHDHCIQVVVGATYILVVRARSLTLFPNPPLTTDPPIVHAPLALHSFGWVDGVAVTTIIGDSPHPDSSSTSTSPPVPPLSILIRPEPDDPWAADDAHSLDLYVLHPEPLLPNSTLRPYSFPPVRTARVASTRGSLQCSALHLGTHGSAVWIEPHDRSATGLLHDPFGAVPLARQNERLVCAAFPGPLFRDLRETAGLESSDSGEHEPVVVVGRTLRSNELNNWKALDYDEVRGRVAVGSTRGRITVLSLAGPRS
ncbi:hypothetical protein DFH06DRAFT_1220338 [Mycena polygramma]|nr:hypothetical protein DFH06DRAFT_1220338 [Mycena polygramma]